MMPINRVASAVSTAVLAVFAAAMVAVAAVVVVIMGGIVVLGPPVILWALFNNSGIIWSELSSRKPAPTAIEEQVTERELIERGCPAHVLASTGRTARDRRLRPILCDAELLSLQRDIAVLESRQLARLLSIMTYPIAK